MYDDITKIQQLIKDKEDELGSLHTIMSSDFDLLTLKEYEAEAGYESYTSSAPRNFFDKVIDGVNRAELTIQIRLPEDASEKDRRGASVGELYLLGALNEIDRNFRNMGEPLLREQMAYYIGLRGWIGLRVLVYPLKDRTVFDILVWDILHTTWEKGPNGLLWAASKRKLTKAQIKSEYDIDIKGKDAELIDWFDEERNSVIIEDDWAKKPREHKIGHVPCFILPVGSMPTLQTKDYKSTIEYRGDSVWSASRNLYKPMNKITSRLMDVYERAVVGSIVHKSKDGKKALADDPYKTWQEIKIEEGEEITPLELPKAPPETAALHSIINTDIQTSTLPYPLAYGGTRQAMSGAALGVLIEGTRSVYSPRTGCLEQSFTWLCEELLGQYNERGIKVNLRGFQPDGKFFSVKVKPREIDPEWYVVVKCEPRMPRDREAEIMMSLAATQRRGPEDIPLVSKQTAREDILGLRDPDAEGDKALAEMGMALQPILISQIVAALKKRGREDLAQDVLMLLNPQGAQRQQQPQLPPELIMAAVEALSVNPETAPIAEAIMKVMGVTPPGGAMPQGGGPVQGAPPVSPGVPPGAPV